MDFKKKFSEKMKKLEKIPVLANNINNKKYNSHDPVDLKNPPDEYVHYDAALKKFIGNVSEQVYPSMNDAVQQNSNMDESRYLKRLGIEDSSKRVDGYPKNYPNKRLKPEIQVKNSKSLDWIDAHKAAYENKELENKNNPYYKNFEKTGSFTKKRDTWKEFVETGQLPKLSAEEIKKVQGDRRVRKHMLRGYKPEKKIPRKADINLDMSVLEIPSDAAPVKPTKTFEDHYREVVERENNMKGLRHFAPILKALDDK